MNYPVKIKLSKAIKMGSETLEFLSVKSPRLKHMKHFDEKRRLQSIKTISAKLTAVPETILDQMSFSDGFKMVNLVGKFLAPFRPTGEMQ
jgi:hypothetical protein